MKFYAGVGSRQTPPDVLAVMRRLAKKLADSGWVLRSGGAAGADSAFEAGAGQKEIYRPEMANADAMSLAASVHPAWERCSTYARRLHARNCFQILGAGLDDPAAMVICWTPDGATTARECTIRTGGTGTAIRLAEKFKVPVRNLARPDHLAAAKAWLES